jgi:sugar lactone lactonase YvrE
VLGVGGLSTQGGQLLGIEGEFPQELDGASCAGQPADCAQVLAAARATAGTLGKVTPGSWHVIAGVGASDFQWTVDHQSEFPGSEEDSNPYGLLGLPGGTYVADAGSNLLDSVGANGKISVLFRFPDPVPAEPFPADGVPTCVAMTPNGQFYVGDLAGRIWRMSAGGTVATMVLPSTSGMHFTGCEADAAGNVYFVSIFSGTPFPGPGSGSLIKLAPTGAITPVVTHLNFPNKVAVGFDGSLYVSVNTVCPATPGPCGPATGSVVRITP